MKTRIDRRDSSSTAAQSPWRALSFLLLFITSPLTSSRSSNGQRDRHHWGLFPTHTADHNNKPSQPLSLPTTRRLPPWRHTGSRSRSSRRGIHDIKEEEEEANLLKFIRGGAIFPRRNNNNSNGTTTIEASSGAATTPPAKQKRPALSFPMGVRPSGGASEAVVAEHNSNSKKPPSPPPPPPAAPSTPPPPPPTTTTTVTTSQPPMPSSPPPVPPPPQQQQAQPQSSQQVGGSTTTTTTSTTTTPPPPPLLAATAAAALLATSNNNAAYNNGQYGNGIFLPLPTVTPPKPRYLDVISVYANGTTVQHQKRKSELAVELRCPTRDLRLLDTSFPSSVATFLARKNAIVLRMDRIRCVIRRNELILFDPYSKDATALVPMLQQQLATVAALTAASGGASTALSPFELLALEAVLANVCHMVHERLQVLSPHITRILGDLKFRQGTLSSFPKLLDELLPLRNDLSELHYTVQELRKAMNDVLLSDEDMEMMYLSSSSNNRNHHNHHHPPPPSSAAAQQQHHHRGKHHGENHQEVEMMFENYLMQLEWADTEIREVQHAIRNTEDTVEIQLDLLRNRILRFELVLGIVSSVVSFGCLVTGLFGMNLLSGWEAHPSAFYLVTVVGGGIMIAVLALAFWYGIRSHIF